MSSFASDGSFPAGMSALLLKSTAEFKVDNKEIPFEDIVSHPPHLRELSAKLARHGWPWRNYKEIEKELVRLHARWQKKKLTYPTEAYMLDAFHHPMLWVEESEDEDDIFMPTEASKRAAAAAAASKGKGAASSKRKAEASSKGKGAASSKGKGAASSKGKSDAGGCVDGR